MPPSWISGLSWSGPIRTVAVAVAVTLTLLACGCNRVAGNYPHSEVMPTRVFAQLTGAGFQLLAGSRLPLEQVEAELGQLKSQGFSRRDPQIIRSVARRKNIPVALLGDGSGSSYYRFIANLEPGADLTLAPGGLEVTVKTRAGTAVVRDQGFLLEDRRIPPGCRPPTHSTLVFQSPERDTVKTVAFLVRLPVRGEIVALDLAPTGGGMASKAPPP